ncbi:MAG: hypothetical protein KJ970_00850 [Candidatus Eisenbacteria bacterium]|uniref:DUF4292 domain-containing protein n=1 Tax=Eiseniibacteriota bacterium TaxID=2212470 RepID=A0A948RWB3_UNCEI|nr:hypothetical protein [Candidatus Eisenbacteria bacterium]MBU1949017.1 hypothetical protein [Candidatus Eisenbacteria bacterium]MBU2689449.1 hypothetical protein [Candidatus Eisenbacteria bacterium]
MQKGGIHLPILFLCLALAGGCTRAPAPAPFPGEAAGLDPAIPAAYEARLAVRYQREGDPAKAVQARWRAGPEGTLLVSAHYGPLVPLLALAVHPDSFYLNLTRENLFARSDSLYLLRGGSGRFSAGKAGLWMRAILEPHTLAALLFRPHSSERNGMRILRGLADGPSGRLVAEVWRDGATGRIRQWSIDDVDGRRYLIVEYPDDAWGDGDFLPARVMLFWPGEQSRLWIQVSRVKGLDPPPLIEQFRLREPPDSERIDLKNPMDPMLLDSPDR